MEPPTTSSAAVKDEPQVRTMGPSDTALECSECAAPVAADGALRAALLVPCLHVLHVSCVEFTRRRAKLVRVLSSELDGWVESTLAAPGTAGGSDRSIFETSSTFVCPGCQQPVSRVVPLFLPGGGGPPPAPATAAAEACEGFERTLRAQKRLLHRLRRLLEQREHVTSLGRQCAALHTRRAEGLQEVKRYSDMFPSTTGAAADCVGVAPLSTLERMGATELELYLAEAAPLLARTQGALMKERRAVERRRAKLAAVKTQYHTMKEIAQLDKEIAAAKQQHQQQQQQRLEPQSSSAGLTPPLTSGGDAAPGRSPLPPCKRRRERAAIDVDSATATVRRAPPITLTIDDDGVEECDAVAATIVSSDSDVDVDDDVVIDEDSGMPDQHLLPPSLVRRSGVNPAPQRLHANHLRMLPRLQDRLWQPSLKF